MQLCRCATKNDTKSRMRELYNNFLQNRVEDKGQEIFIGVVFHICFRSDSTIIATSSEKETFGFQPRIVRALEASPKSVETSAFRRLSLTL